MGLVAPRVLARLATLWSALYLLVYVRAIAAQGGTIAWWYVALVVLVVLTLGVAGAGLVVRAALPIGLALAVVSMMLGLLSVGVLLAPAVVAAALALVLTGGTRRLSFVSG